MSNNFLLPDELAEFATTLSKTFATHFPIKFLRTQLLDLNPQNRLGSDALTSAWQAIVDSGAILACLPESVGELDGGLGFGTVAAQLILFEAGKHLVTAPLTETICFGILPLLTSPESLARNSAIEVLAAGSGGLTSAVSGAFQELLEGDLCTVTCACEKATPEILGSPTTITGKATFVPSLERVGKLVVPAVDKSNQIVLTLVDRSAIANNFKHVQSVDVLRPYYEVTFDDTPAEILAHFPQDAAALIALLDEIRLLLASEMAGAASHAVTLTLDYAKTRQQFGKPIGSFQAIAHQLSDMYLQTEATQALCRFAAWAVEHSPEQARAACLAAKANCSEALPKVVLKAIQVHGGIGFTHEYELHYFVRRVRALAALGGSPQACAATLAQLDVSDRLEV